MTEMKKLEKEDMKSADIVKENIQQLKQVFPEVFSEDKINFEKLEEILGNYVNQDEDHYNFTWHGKKKAARLAQTPSTGTLRPAKDESVDFDSTGNLFIEGDNLEVLKLLQKSYHRQVKMIYIDPPYNTGNDFVYEDDFRDGVKNYLEMTGQIDSEGKKLGTNSSSTGRYHTNWLNMMYPRLKLARNLLRDDGVIFISIDDNEQANLKKLCDEVFGEENFVGSFIWRKKTGASDAKGIAVITEYIILYSKDIRLIDKSLTRNKNSYDPKRYRLSDEYENRRGKYYIDNLDRGGIQYSDSMNYPIECPDGRITYPNGRTEFKNDGWIWTWGKDKLKWGIKNGFIEFRRSDSKESGWSVCYKNYVNVNNKDELQERSAPHKNLILDIINTEGTKDISNLFDTKVFQYTKPVNLLKTLNSCVNLKDNDLILDFFAGSGTTAHAVMQLNSEDGGNRKCISVQFPEIIDDTEKKKKDNAEAIKFLKSINKPINIAEISKERIRRAAKKIKEENPDYQGDLGFKVFKLDSSNIKRWDASFDDLKQNLIDAVDYIKQDRSNDDIVYEILLKYGLDLAVPIEIREIAGAKIYIIGFGALVICLDKNITMEVVNGICTLKTELSPEIMRVVFSDNGFKDDVIKTNAIATLKRAGIEDIKSL